MSIYFCECGAHIDDGSNSVIHHLAGHYGQMLSLIHALGNLHTSDQHPEPLCTGCTNTWPCSTHRILASIRHT